MDGHTNPNQADTPPTPTSQDTPNQDAHLQARVHLHKSLAASAVVLGLGGFTKDEYFTQYIDDGKSTLLKPPLHPMGIGE